MRPIHHPNIEDITVEGILYALSDPIRAKIVAGLHSAACAKNCSTFLTCKGDPLPKSTLSQHFKILRDAGLVRSEREGVELKNTLRCNELKERFGGLIETILKSYVMQHEASKKRRGR